MQPELHRGESDQVRTFRQSRSGDFAATLLVIAPFASWLIHRSVGAALLATLALVVGLPWWWTRLGRRALAVTDDALEVVTLFGLKRVSWSQAFYAYSPNSDASTSQGLIADAAINLATAAVGLLSRRKKLIGTKLTIGSSNGVSVCLDDYVGARSIEAKVVAQIHRGSGADTRPFEVSSEHVQHHDHVLTFSQLERVVVAAEVEFLRAGARAAWASASLTSVHNVWLLVQRLLEHGVQVDLAIEAPSEIVASAEEAAARQANILRATIVNE